MRLLPQRKTRLKKMYRPCRSESDNDCVWDAKHLGNGRGRSYVATAAGQVIYISHARAHRLWVRWLRR